MTVMRNPFPTYHRSSSIHYSMVYPSFLLLSPSALSLVELHYVRYNQLHTYSRVNTSYLPWFIIIHIHMHTHTHTYGNLITLWISETYLDNSFVRTNSGTYCSPEIRKTEFINGDKIMRRITDDVTTDKLFWEYFILLDLCCETSWISRPFLTIAT